MRKPDPVSAFLLERGRLGEIRRGEGRRLERALAGDPALAASLADLEKGDREFRERFSKERFLEGVKAKADQEGGHAPLAPNSSGLRPCGVLRYPLCGALPRNAPLGGPRPPRPPIL